MLGYGVYGLWANSHQGYVSANPAKWLPKQQLDHPVDGTVVGTYTSPAITVAGDDVRVHTPTFSALAVVIGPAVPGEGLSYQPKYLTSTWTVHIWDVKGYTPLAAKDFDTIDHAGTEFQLRIPPGGTMPKSVSTGQAGHLPVACRGARRGEPLPLGAQRQQHRRQVGQPGGERLNGPRHATGRDCLGRWLGPGNGSRGRPRFRG